MTKPSSRFVVIDLNGSTIKVKSVYFKESPIGSDEYFHDCYITFLNDETERYDASDVTVLKPGEYNESDLSI